jgi:hypothetical protein
VSGPRDLELGRVLPLLRYQHVIWSAAFVIDFGPVGCSLVLFEGQIPWDSFEYALHYDFLTVGQGLCRT